MWFIKGSFRHVGCWVGRCADVRNGRYYHLFKQGEIDELVAEAGGKIIESGYEKDNYYVICGW